MLLKALRVRDDPLTLFRKLRAQHPTAFLLQSAEGPRRLAEYSMLGFDPSARVVLDGRWRVEGDVSIDDDAPPAQVLRSLLPKPKGDDHGYRFLGGLVGAFGYEYAARLERLPRHAGSGPDLDLGLYLDGIVFDHVRSRVLYFSHTDRDRSALVEQAAAGQAPDTAPAHGRDLRRTPDEPRFLKMVEKAKHHIAEGDVFQVVLSKRTEGAFEGDPLALYEALLRTNPSPYMYCVGTPERTIVGSSPEMLVRVDHGKVETFPIAGTRPLGETPKDTERLAREMLQDPKERAEHSMLVDLARNDIGRVARFGSVRVKDMMRVERYSHVQHMVSLVEGDLAPDKDMLDAFDALFPAGTVSGAPKVRAMEIIHDLEGQARGAYAGAVGYVGLHGNLDAAITIRTAVIEGSRIRVQAGAGIVADSVPAMEWRETEAKSAALLRLLEAP